MVDSNGTVHVYFSPNAYGIGTLLHEMLHKMNECNILQEVKPATTQTDLYFNETASILGELLFYDYLLNKGYINKSDYKKALAFRLNDSKECAKTCIIENELIQLKLEGKEINLENLQNLIGKYDEDTIERKIYDEERKYPERLLFIEKKGILDYPTSQRYVIAQVFSDDISKRNSAFEDFKKINNFVSSSNSLPNDVCSIYNEGNHSR